MQTLWLTFLFGCQSPQSQQVEPQVTSPCPHLSIKTPFRDSSLIVNNLCIDSPLPYWKQHLTSNMTQGECSISSSPSSSLSFQETALPNSTDALIRDLGGTLFFFLKRLFIHERHTERGRDIGRGRNRLHAGSPLWDLILRLWDHTLRPRQTLNH